MQFLIETSGWTYDHWKGCFYPATWQKAAGSTFMRSSSRQLKLAEVRRTSESASHLAAARAEAERTLQMSIKMGNYLGKLDAQEILDRIK